MSSGFGGATSNTGSTGFGGGGLGGGSAFSQPNNTGGGLFGAQNNNANNNQSGFGASSTGGGLFGAKSQGPSSFGSNPTTSTQPSGGLFASAGSGGFGAANTGNTGASLFGNNQNKPFGNTGGGFGQNNSQGSSSLFGGNNNSNTTNNNSGGGFGQTSNQQPGFGGGGFGQNNQASTGSGGLFGSSFGQGNNNNNNSGSSLFGQKSPNQAGNSLFGGNNQQNTAQPSGGLFGNSSSSNNNNNNPGGGLFGQKSQAPSGGLFGNTNNNTGGSSLFSNLNNTNNQQNTGSSLFGNQNQQKPGGLFGNSTANNAPSGGGLFGNLNQNGNQQTGGSSLFANPSQQQPQLGNSLFPSAQPAQQQLVPQQPTQLTTSILAQHPYGNEGLFASLAPPQQSPGPVATPLSGSQRAKKPAAMPFWRTNPAASGRLLTPQKRGGYGFSYSTYGTPGSAYGSPRASSIFGSTNRSLHGSRSATNLRNFNTDNSLVAAGAFTPGASSTRPRNMKKLHINRNIKTNNLFGEKEGSDRAQPSPLRKAVSFEDENREAPRRIEATQPNGETSNALVRVDEEESDTPTPSTSTQVNGSATAQEMERVKGNELAIVPEESASDDPVEAASKRARLMQTDQIPGDYFMAPTTADLLRLPRSDLKSFKGLTVGRVNAGKITFDSVNLDGIDLDSIMGGIVVLEIRSATVYPDHATKPPEGKGLNVPAKVTLANSWPRSRAGQLPLFENKGPRFEKHIDRLRRVAGTEFVEYKTETGEWVFRVNHFSSYKLDYSDDGESDAENHSSILSAPPDFIERMSHRDDSSLGNQSYGAESSHVDDTFEFRRSRIPPGAFDADAVSEYTSPSMDAEMSMDLPEKAAETEEDLNDGSPDGEQSQPPRSSQMAGSFPGLDGNMDFDDNSPRHPPARTISKPPKSILKPTQRQPSIFGSPIRARPNANAGWADQLQRTLSPKKQDRQALRESQGYMLKRAEPSKGPAKDFSKEASPFATSIDIMNSLFGEAKGNSNQGKKQGAGSKGLKV